MYFKGQLSIDPSQLTHIQKVEPTGGFKKILFNLTGGSIAEKKEVETFKALNIIQQLYDAFKNQHIDNIIKLSHDDIDIYVDNEGKENDFDEAISLYSLEINDAMSTHFDKLWMVLEHKDATFKYLYEIHINRSHKVGAYPIEIKVIAMLSEFDPKNYPSEAALKEKVQSLFKNQAEYNAFVTNKKMVFDSVLNNLRFELRKHIRIDDIKSESKSTVVLSEKKKKAKTKETSTEREPAHEGTPFAYGGFAEFMLFSFIWSELLFDNHFEVSNLDLVSDSGDIIGEIGSEGMLAEAGSVFDYNTNLDARMEDFGGLEDVGLDGVMDDSGSWFDGITEGFEGGFDFDIDI
jgi:hypothetical protein